MKLNRLLLVLLITAYSLQATVAFAQSAPDPIKLSTGARPLGMGKAFVGLADDVSSIFLNPAGLATPQRWQVTSMSGKLIDEYNYLSFSGLYPTNYGNLGLAYCGTSIGGALPTTIEAGSDPNDPIYTVDLSQEQMSYYNNLLIMSYGNVMDPIFNLPLLNGLAARWPGLRGVKFGANLKFFSVNLTGDGITNGNGTGNELDLGVHGKPLNWLSLGANLQNALPMSMGGKLRYTTGWEENYPAVLKLGLAADVIGQQNALRRIGSHQIKLLADVDYEPTRADFVPPLFHLGLEWKPTEIIGIRSGIDQEMVTKSEIANNLTAGVGIYFGDFRFDYAYHAFASAPGIDNHFFSLSYGIAPVKLIKDPLLTSPDKVITTETFVAVSGVALDTRIVEVKVAGLKVKMNARGEFNTNVSLKVGKNAVLVQGYNRDGKQIAYDVVRVLRLITYPDVAGTFWAAEPISYIGTLGIIKGYPDGKFKPQGSITRAELSTLLIRTKMGGDDKVPAATGRVFKDVPVKHWAAKYVNLAAKDGIVKGYPDKTFKPSAKVTRAEGLTMIARFGKVKEILYTSEFIDVKRSHWASPIIAGAYKEGMLVYLQNKPFEPNRKLTRAEAVEMLYRSKPVSGMIADLLNFNKGYEAKF